MATGASGSSARRPATLPPVRRELGCPPPGRRGGHHQRRHRRAGEPMDEPAARATAGVDRSWPGSDAAMVAGACSTAPDGTAARWPRCTPGRCATPSRCATSRPRWPRPGPAGALDLLGCRPACSPSSARSRTGVEPPLDASQPTSSTRSGARTAVRADGRGGRTRALPSVVLRPLPLTGGSAGVPEPARGSWGGRGRGRAGGSGQGRSRPGGEAGHVVAAQRHREVRGIRGWSTMSIEPPTGLVPNPLNAR